MPETPKEKTAEEKEVEDSPKKVDEAREEGAWSRDQREKSYYYDDSHGYEIYKPDIEDDEEDE